MTMNKVNRTFFKIIRSLHIHNGWVSKKLEYRQAFKLIKSLLLNNLIWTWFLTPNALKQTVVFATITVISRQILKIRIVNRELWNKHENNSIISRGSQCKNFYFENEILKKLIFKIGFMFLKSSFSASLFHFRNEVNAGNVIKSNSAQSSRLIGPWQYWSNLLKTLFRGLGILWPGLLRLVIFA